MSDEEEAQVARFGYILAAGAKELLVDRPIQWPGVHSLRALLKDEPLTGWWFDRSREYAARRRGEKPGRYDFAFEEVLMLDPLPCWRHLAAEEVRRRVRDLVREIEREVAAELFHAFRDQVRKAIWEAYAWVVAEYREAAERLKAGDRLACFPEGTFHPGLPFIPFARGHPP